MSSVVVAFNEPLSVVELATSGPRSLKVSPAALFAEGFIFNVPSTVVVPDADSVYVRNIPAGSDGLKVRL